LCVPESASFGVGGSLGPRRSPVFEFASKMPSYFLSEGTSEIQRLVISRAMSGVHIQ
jgi:hypothetical protein